MLRWCVAAGSAGPPASGRLLAPLITELCDPRQHGGICSCLARCRRHRRLAACQRARNAVHLKRQPPLLLGASTVGSLGADGRRTRPCPLGALCGGRCRADEHGVCHVGRQRVHLRCGKACSQIGRGVRSQSRRASEVQGVRQPSRRRPPTSPSPTALAAAASPPAGHCGAVSRGGSRPRVPTTASLVTSGGLGLE